MALRPFYTMPDAEDAVSIRDRVTLETDLIWRYDL